MTSQKGVAFVLALLLLIVLLIVGVTGFSNTNLQDRGAENARLQTFAFEAASAGANDALNFFIDHQDQAPDQLCGSIGHAGWEQPTDWVEMGTVGGASLRQRMYCLAEEHPCSEGADGCESGNQPARSRLFVLSRGEVKVANEAVARRDIEVRIAVAGTGNADGHHEAGMDQLVIASWRENSGWREEFFGSD